MVASDDVWDRRTFLHAAGGTVAAVVLGWESAALATGTPQDGGSFPRQDPALVERVVRFSHFDLDAVRELVAERPELAKASWDWGFGDWETPIGAASHVGRRDIAELLLGHGARATLFTLAMLGDTDAVRATIEARPGIERTRGPHGLTLLHHARAGGDEAGEVVAYLEERGDADPRLPDRALTADERGAYLGTYRIAGEGGNFRIVDRDGRIGFRAPEGAPRDLLHRGEGVFHPVGAPGVRIRFDLRDGRARSVTIVAGPRRWTGERIRD